MISMVPGMCKLPKMPMNAGEECTVVERSEVWRKWATTTTAMSLCVSIWVNVYKPSITVLKCQNMNGKEDKYCSLPPYLEMWKVINLGVCPSYVTITRISTPCYQVDYRSQDTRIKRISIWSNQEENNLGICFSSPKWMPAHTFVLLWIKIASLYLAID